MGSVSDDKDESRNNIFMIATACCAVVFVMGLYLEGLFGVGTKETWWNFRAIVLVGVFCGLMIVTGAKWKP